MHSHIHCQKVELLWHDFVALFNGCHTSQQMCVKHLECCSVTLYKCCIAVCNHQDMLTKLGCSAKLYLNQYHLACSPSGKRVIPFLYMLQPQPVVFVFSLSSAASTHVCIQEYMTEMTHCLARLDVQPDSPTEGRLQQLTFKAFMLAEETFIMKACDNNAKAMTLCRWHEHAPIPEHVYVKLLVSHCTHHETTLAFASFVSVSLHGSSLHLPMLPVLHMVSCCACEHLMLCFCNMQEGFLDIVSG